MKLTVETFVYINISVYSYSKHHWPKCKIIWVNDYIYTVRMLNVLGKVNVKEHSELNVISHTIDLENLFRVSEHE